MPNGPGTLQDGILPVKTAAAKRWTYMAVSVTRVAQVYRDGSSYACTEQSAEPTHSFRFSYAISPLILFTFLHFNLIFQFQIFLFFLEQLNYRIFPIFELY